MDSGPHGGILKIAGTKTGGVKNLAHCKNIKRVAESDTFYVF